MTSKLQRKPQFSPQINNWPWKARSYGRIKCDHVSTLVSSVGTSVNFEAVGVEEHTTVRRTPTTYPTLRFYTREIKNIKRFGKLFLCSISLRSHYVQNSFEKTPALPLNGLLQCMNNGTISSSDIPRVVYSTLPRARS